MTYKLNILVVGNGIAGSVTAMALQKATNHNVVIVDAGPEDAKPIGSSVGVTPNGMKALKFIGAEHIVEERGGPFMTMMAGKGPTGAILAEENVEEIFKKQYGYPVSFISLIHQYHIKFDIGIRRSTARVLQRLAGAGQRTQRRHAL
jgi:2-polyprenyl-6-methoxyphenol hydroxylase-like FAD-dependent oxidoreductase